MNDDPTLDELVSAYLDGEATVDEVARVEGSAELTARAVTLRAVRDAVAAPVGASPDGHRDQAVSAALRASSTAANVTSLSIRRARSARVVRIASVAAVIALFMLAGSLVLLTRDSGNQSETVASADTAAAETDAAADAPADSAADDEAGAPAEELAAEAPAEPAAEPEMMADEAMGESAEPAAEAPAAEEESAALSERDVLVRFVIEPQADALALTEALLDAIDATDRTGADDFDAEAPLPACTVAYIDGLENEILGVTETMLNGIDVGAVAFPAPDDPDIRVVAIFELDAPACTPVSLIGL